MLSLVFCATSKDIWQYDNKKQKKQYIVFCLLSPLSQETDLSCKVLIIESSDMETLRNADVFVT